MALGENTRRAVAAYLRIKRGIHRLDPVRHRHEETAHTDIVHFVRFTQEIVYLVLATIEIQAAAHLARSMRT